MENENLKADEPWRRIILHADMDAFFAAVEQRDHPEWRGKPLVVGGDAKRGVVSTASYEARRFGLKSAMPMAQALKRCPHVIVVRPDFERYQDASRCIHNVFNRYSPLVEPLSLDEAFIDMTGAEGLFGGPLEMARRIKADVADATGGLTISIGGSVNKYVAKVASDYQKPDGITLVPERAIRDFLAPLPLNRIWGVGQKTRERLETLGLRTIGDVATVSPDRLARSLGTLGRHIHELANGIDPREVIPEHDTKSIGKEVTLSEDVVGRTEIWPYLRRCADQVARRLRSKHLTARGVRVKLKRADFRLLTRQGPLDPPSNSAKALIAAADRLLNQFDLAAPMRLVGIAVFDLEPDTPRQGMLFDDPQNAKQKRLDAAVDAVLTRFGDCAVKRGSDT